MQLRLGGDCDQVTAGWRLAGLALRPDILAPPSPQGTTPLLPHPGPWGSALGQLPREGGEGVGR